MNLGERIEFFIEICYGNKRNFAEILGVRYSTLSKYISGSVTLSINELTLLKKSGMSLNWLIDGEGPMFANNKNGVTLRKRISNEEIELNRPNGRIKYWIKQNYETLENFAVALNLDFDEIYNVLYHDMVMSVSFINILKKAGCNMNWVLTGEGTKFENNPTGIILNYEDEKRAVKIQDEINRDNKDGKNVLPSFLNMFKPSKKISNTEIV